MRVFLIIWSVYLLGLSLVPCSDALNGCEENTPVTENTPAEDQYEDHNHHNDADDGCTPFCYCTCCSISLNIYQFNSFTVREPFISFKEKEAFRYYSDSRSFYFGSIWQPPKINA